MKELLSECRICADTKDIICRPPFDIENCSIRKVKLGEINFKGKRKPKPDCNSCIYKFIS